MSAALAGRVEAAVDALDDDARQALSLRERDGADYRAIAEELETGREGVADLLVQARLTISSHLKDGTVPPRRTPQCGPARRVLAASADGEAVGPSDLERAREHLAGCEPCRTARLALREAELACRAWTANPAAELPVAANRAPLLPESGSNPARLRLTGSHAARLAAGRRRLIAAAVGLVLLIAILAAVFGGSDPTPPPAAPRPGPGSAQGSGKDVVTPPGDKFCPDNRTTCK